jgi:uncharacterized membrane protein (DUF4010 family)
VPTEPAAETLQLGLPFWIHGGRSLLLGIERGWWGREREEGFRAAGIRTFGIVGLLGGLSAVLAKVWGAAVIVVALGGVAAVITASYLLTAPRVGDYGTTTSFALLLAFALGALAVVGDVGVVASVAVVTAALLRLKEPLHRWLAHLEQSELQATLQLLLVAVVVLPILPNRGMGPWQSLNPYEIGLLILLIAGISFVGYFAAKTFGARRGLLLTAVLGGLTSSTAVTLSFSRMSRNSPDLMRVLAAGICAAAATMSPRLLVEVALVERSLLPSIAAPLAVLALVPLAAAVWIVRAAPAAGPETRLPLRNPLQLGMAVRYGAVLASLFLLSSAAHAWLGERGIMLVAISSGLVDVDAVSLSLAGMAGTQIPLGVAGRGIVAAALANTVAKAGLAWAIGGWAISRWVGGVLLVTCVLGIATASLLAAT